MTEIDQLQQDHKKLLTEFQHHKCQTFQKILQLSQFKEDITLDLEEVLRQNQELNESHSLLQMEITSLQGGPTETERHWRLQLEYDVLLDQNKKLKQKYQQLKDKMLEDSKTIENIENCQQALTIKNHELWDRVTEQLRHRLLILKKTI